MSVSSLSINITEILFVRVIACFILQRFAFSLFFRRREVIEGLGGDLRESGGLYQTSTNVRTCLDGSDAVD